MDINMAPNKISLATIGDCCIDIYPEQNKSFLGGTAFNVAYHAQNAGALASIISVVGNDFYGSLFIKTAQECNINTDYLVMKKGKTSSLLT
jgi:fructoselysine 6-kinase